MKPILMVNYYSWIMVSLMIGFNMFSTCFINDWFPHGSNSIEQLFIKAPMASPLLVEYVFWITMFSWKQPWLIDGETTLDLYMNKYWYYPWIVISGNSWGRIFKQIVTICSVSWKHLVYSYVGSIDHLHSLAMQSFVHLFIKNDCHKLPSGERALLVAAWLFL